jgi:hypothetical protein
MRQEVAVPRPIRMMQARRSLPTIEADQANDGWRYVVRGTARALFAATLLLVLGTLNIIYGIGALDGANIFANDQRYVLDDLNTLGWVLIVLGIVQLVGGFSLMAGNVFGRIIGVLGAGLGAIGALLSIGGSYPWWSLGVFLLCIWVIHGIFIYGDDRAVT